MPTEWVLAATMVSPDGSLIPLNPAVSADFYDDYGRFYEWLYSWEVPAQLTNFAHYEFRFSRIKDGKRVATFRLE